MVFEPGTTLTDVALQTGTSLGRLVAWLAREAAQSISTNGTPQAANALSWDAVYLDVWSGWSGATPTRYTATVAGYYLLLGHVGIAGDTTGTIRGSAWFVNGTAATPGQHRTAATPSSATSGAPVRPRPVLLNGTTDYVELVPVHNANSSLNTSTGSNHPDMSVYYVGPP